MTSPNPQIKQSERLVNTWVEWLLLYRVLLLKLFVASTSFMHILTSLALVELCSTDDSMEPNTSPASTMMILGGGLAFLSASLRLWCYAEMADLFDFEVNIKKTHRLVITGPYSFVRHPGYIASLGVHLGVSMVMFSNSSWFYQCGLMHALGVVCGCIWCTEMVLIHGVLILARMKVEDKMLQRHFGREWDQYAKRIPYRLLPKLY
ncbi:hypothetical protein EYR40_008327 [Pleurotus pulmonarius]|nr:hypothetical protein EYR40_008327 [Pleurotus pulmonarius]